MVLLMISTIAFNLKLAMPNRYNSLVFVFVFLLLLPQALSLCGSIAKPNCTDRCGNLSIPFPFGLGSSCSLGPSFTLRCENGSNSPAPKAYLSNMIGTQVIGINLNPPQIRVKYQNLASSCYGERVYRRYYTLFNLTSTQYSLSDQNWLTAIGCDDMMAVVGDFGAAFGGGCVSFCQDGNANDNVNGSCPDSGNGSELGDGCCRTPIPRGTTYLIINLTDVRQNWQRKRKLYSCSYAFLGEKNQSGFSYPLSYLDNSTRYDNFSAFVSDNPLARITPPVVLDWRIGAETSCHERNISSYACKSANSFCVPANITGGGYYCQCEQGYEGNPYMTQGCQDINECATPSLNYCGQYCVNTMGSYKCLCPKGYHGDGRKHGSGCTKLPAPKMLIVSIGLGSGMGFLLLLLMCFSLHKILKKRENKMRKDKFFKRNGGLLLQQQTNEGTIGQTKLFPAKELEKATDHFNESRILGQGGQGTVYKGMLSDGKIVAIKKSKLVDEDQLEEFINEVALLSQINHRNVVKLLGCCLEIEVPYLVFEFVPNGTLFDFIHETNTEFPVSWNMRLKIAADIAGALAYLHSASSVPIFHRDIKSSNILLDEKYVVKVSDFGISKSFTVDQTHLTTIVKGTMGYLDPEYFQSSQFTEKSNVYSFGVVLLELLTGQRPVSLAARFLESMEANNLDTMLDPQVVEQGRKEEVVAVARLAKRCLNLNGKMRPTMKAVTTELESLRISQMHCSTIKDECREEARVCEAKAVMISDIEYTWTNSINSEASSSSADTHPLMFATA